MKQFPLYRRARSVAHPRLVVLWQAVLLCAGFGAGSNAFATTDVVSSLYSAEVRAESRDDAAREDALRRALAEVMVKVSGDVRAPSGAGRAVLGQAEALVSQFRFEAMPEPESDLEGDASAVAQPAEAVGFRFVASFVPGAVNAAMADQGVPVWSARRPRTLAFVAIDGRGQVVDAADAARAAVGLIRGAEARGIPLTFPRGDFDERALLDIGNVWAVAEQPLRAAASRYRPAELLVVRLTGSNGSGWRARATRLSQAAPDNRAPDQWSRTAATQNAALLAIANSYADLLAERYAQQVASGPEVDLNFVVTGVTSFAAHATVLNAVSGVSGVSHVNVQQLANRANVYAVRTRLTTEQLRAALTVLPELREDRYAALTFGAGASAEPTQTGSAYPSQPVQGGGQAQGYGRDQSLPLGGLVFAYDGPR